MKTSAYDPLLIRKHSIELLKPEGIEIPDRVPPLLEPALSLRSAQEIRDRAICIFATLAGVFDGTKSAAKMGYNWLEKNGLTSALAQREREFFENKLSGKRIQKDARIELTHHVEALWALAWLDSHIAKLNNRDQVEDTLGALFPNVIENEKPSYYWQSAELRPISEVVTVLDELYCRHWWIVENRIIGPTPASPVPNFVIRWRRYALEWAVCSDEWDDISLDT